MGVRAKIEGAKSFRDLNGNLRRSLRSNKLGKTIMRKTYELVVQYAPVDTGALVNSVRLIEGRNIYYIIITVPYAEFMEYGTRYFPVGTPSSPRSRVSKSGKQCLHPFMRTAVWDVMNEFDEIVKRALFSKF